MMNNLKGRSKESQIILDLCNKNNVSCVWNLKQGSNKRRLVMSRPDSFRMKIRVESKEFSEEEYKQMQIYDLKLLLKELSIALKKKEREVLGDELN